MAEYNIFQRSLSALAFGLLSYVSLAAMPYYPPEWAVTIALASLVAGYMNVSIAITISVGAFGIALGHQSFELLIILFLFLFAMRVWVSDFFMAPEVFFLIVGTPFLAFVQLGQHSLPLEFAVVFIAPAVLDRGRVPLIAAIACFFCVVVGIIGQQSVIGNLIIGGLTEPFFTIGTAQSNFYDLRWMIPYLNMELVLNTISALRKIGVMLIQNPMVFFQVLAWAMSGLAMSSFLDARVHKKKMWLHGAGIAAGCGVFAAAQMLVIAFESQVSGIDPVRYIVSLTSCGAAFLAIWEIQKYVRDRALEKELEPASQYAEMVRQRQGVRSEGLSLEESLKLQKELQQHIQAKFVQRVTALDIDIAGSTKMKEGETQEAILASFKEFWKFIDLAGISNGGRLLNRAGDGAVFMFEQADRAVMSAAEMIKNLNEFNKNKHKNALKTPFSVRIGLHSGEMMQDPTKKTQGGDVFSRVIDIAAHLQKKAESCDIVISEKTYQQLKNRKGFVKSGFSEADNVVYYTMKK